MGAVNRQEVLSQMKIHGNHEYDDCAGDCASLMSMIDGRIFMDHCIHISTMSIFDWAEQLGYTDSCVTHVLFLQVIKI